MALLLLPNTMILTSETVSLLMLSHSAKLLASMSPAGEAHMYGTYRVGVPSKLLAY